MHVYHYMPAAAVKRFRREAKRRSREGSITFCQALDAIAREKHFPHWGAVAGARAMTAAAEHTLLSGFVIAMDVKEGMDLDRSVGFIDDPLVASLVFEQIATENIAAMKASSSPAAYFEDPDAGDTWEGWHSLLSHSDEVTDVESNTTVLTYAGPVPISTPEAASQLLCDICFWRPLWMWFNGVRYSGSWINEQVYGPIPARYLD